MRAGEVIADRFEVVEVAGSGGMGIVLRAIDRAAGGPVAIKLMREAHDVAEARFALEAQALAELDHPHIVRYVTHGLTAAAQPFLVMEWLDGESLADRLAREALAIDEAVDLGRGVASALAAAHARGVVHRDIKPSNIYLCRGSVDGVKLLDFGIATFGAAPALTRSGTVIGTPGYMAPEQARGERGIVDARADVFSLGCVLFECLTGRPAFHGAQVMALLAKLLMEDPPRVDELRPAAPRRLVDLVARMLSKDPIQRPADGAAVMRALDEISEGGALSSLRRPGAPASITGTEKRLVSVVALVPSEGRAALETAVSGALQGRDRRLFAQMRRALEPLGAKVEELANGVLIALLVGAGPATDMAALAARSAIRMRILAPASPMVLLTGRSEGKVRLELGEVLERAASMLQEAGEPRRADEARLPIRIDELTRDLLDVRFEIVQREGRVLLRGEREIGGEARTLLGKASPFVGRHRELSHILSLVDEGFEERASRALVVTGAAGMGKSRLRYELVRAVRERYPGIALAIGRGDSIGAGTAFAMLGGAFRSTFSIAAGEPPASQRAKLQSSVNLFLPERERRRVTEFLGEMIGVPFPDEGSPKLSAARQSASIMAEQIREAFIDFVKAVTEARPALLVLEDVQWGDAPSIKLIDAALRDLEGRPFVVVGFARPEVYLLFPRMWVDRSRTEIRLNVLPRRAAEALARDALGPSVDPEIIAGLVDRAAGNAFYLEELIRAVAEGRAGSLPETVLGMVEARLLTLSPESRRMLRAASVFGEVFWRSGVERLLGHEAPTLGGPDPFAELIEAEVLVRRHTRRFAGEDEYGFRHSLLREGAHAMLTDRDRTTGHRLAAEWLEAAGEQDPKILAEHFHRGGEPARAAKYHLAAAELSCAGNDYGSTIELCDRAIASSDEPDLLADAWALRAEAAFWSADHAQAVSSAERALALARPGSVSDCRALSWMLAGALFSGKMGQFDVYLDRLLCTDPDPAAVGMLASGFNSVMMYLVSSAQRGRIEASLRRLERVTRGVAERDALVAAWVAYNRATWERTVMHDLWGALEQARVAAAQFERAGANGFLPYVHIYVGQDHALLGLYERADQELSEALKGAAPGTIPAQLGAYFHAFALLGRGRLEEARRRAASVARTAEARGDRLVRLLVGVLLAEIELVAGDLAAAEREALSLEAAARELPYQSMLHATLMARIRLSQGRAEEALSIAEGAVAQSRALGMGHHLRHAALLLVRAEALGAVGQRAAAAHAIREARDRLSKLSESIPDPAVRRAFLENVEENRRTLELARQWLEEPVTP